MSYFSLENKIALVTGATRGLGRAIAIRLAHHGAHVIGTATSEQGSERITEMFQERGLTGMGLVMDVTNPDSIQSGLEVIESKWRMPDILVNNAGITRDTLLLRMKLEDWDAVIATNLSATFHTTRACLKAMVKLRWGRIINISSAVALAGNPGQCNYAAAKAGMIGFSKSLAKEVASRNITVNCVAPGYIETDMTKELPQEYKTQVLATIPQQRMGSPEDIAAAVVFLASNDAGYITGETINVNGGLFMH